MNAITLMNQFVSSASNGSKPLNPMDMYVQELKLPLATVNALNISHRTIAIFINLFLIVIYVVACVNIGTCGALRKLGSCLKRNNKRNEKKEAKRSNPSAKLSLLLNYTLIYICLRLSSEIFRLVAVSLPLEVMFNTWVDNVSKTWCIGLYVGGITMLTLLIESWLDVCSKFVSHPKVMVWIIRTISIALNVITHVVAVVTCTLLIFPRGMKQRAYGELMLKFVSYPSFVLCVVVLGIEVTVIGVTIMVIVKGKLFKSTGTIFTKITACIIIVWVCNVARLVVAVALGANALSGVGEWIAFVVNMPEWISQAVIALVFLPYGKCCCCLGRNSADEGGMKQEEQPEPRKQEISVEVNDVSSEHKESEISKNHIELASVDHHTTANMNKHTA